MTANDKKWLIGGIVGAVVFWGFVIYYRKKIVKTYKDVGETIYLTAEQEVYMKGLHEKARPIMREFIRRIENETDYKVRINSGYRSFQEQAKLRAKMGSGAASPGKSPHNFGMAIDISPINKKTGKQIMKADVRKVWEATGIPKIAKEMNLRWGADFVGGTGGYDPVHFDAYTALGVTGQQLYDATIKQFGGVENAKGNEVKI